MRSIAHINCNIVLFHFYLEAERDKS